MSEPADYRGIGCDEFAQMAAELALGVLTGRERAVALAHLDGCESCRELVRELTMTGEELLALLPSREPPVGFETRVLERIGVSAPDQPAPPRLSPPGPGPQRSADRPAGRGPDRPPGRPRTRRIRTRTRSLLAAAAVVVALVGAGLGGWGLRAATQSPGSSVASPVSSAALVTSADQTVGMVFVTNSSPWWMDMSVNLDSLGNSVVKCQLENAAGQFIPLGNFRLDDGYGTWASAYSSNSAIVGARLLSANGTVLATASFS
jgi:hypothetical protein